MSRFARKRDDETDYVELTVTVKYATDRALLVDDGTRQDWIPIRCIADPTEAEAARFGETVTIEVAEWIAKDRGFI